MKKAAFLACLATVIAASLSAVFLWGCGTEKAKTEPFGKRVEISGLCQFPDLPTGCEAVSAVMVLNFCGEKVTPAEFVSDWLTCDDRFYASDQKQYGPDPREVFVGDPASGNGMGCYAGAIVRAVNGHSALCRAEELSCETLEELCRLCIDRDEPVIVWATIDMEESFRGKAWYLEDGSKFVWTAKEHCLVLTGYGESCFWFTDPRTGEPVSYPKELAQRRFEELGCQAVRIFR